MVADMAKTYNSWADVTTYHNLLEANRKGTPSALPTMMLVYGHGVKNNKYDNYTALMVPPTFQLWHSLISQPEKPAFLYKWQPKCKMLRRITELMQTPNVNYHAIPVCWAKPDVTKPTCHVGHKNCKYHNVLTFDYKNGFITYPLSTFCPDIGQEGTDEKMQTMNMKSRYQWEATGTATGTMFCQWNESLNPQSKVYCPKWDHSIYAGTVHNADNLPLHMNQHTEAYASASIARTNDRACQYGKFNQVTGAPEGRIMVQETHPNTLPFVSDQKLRPAWMKAELLFHDKNILPYNIYAIIHVVYEIAVYKADMSSTLLITADAPATDGVMSLNSLMYGYAPVRTIGTEFHSVKEGNFNFNNSYYIYHMMSYI